MEIFDRRKIEANKARASAQLAQHDFLHRYAADEIAARLKLVEREFRLIADIGAGHGVLTAAVRSAFPSARVVSVEPSAALLPHVSAGLRVQAREDALPLHEGAFDLIVSGFGLHLVNDLPGALVQMRRALKPDGLVMAALAGGDTLSELREALMLAEIDLSGGVSPRVFPTADVREMGGLLQRAGFALPVADAERLTVTYTDAIALMRDLRAMGAANALLSRSRRPMSRAMLAHTAALYAEKFPAPGGRVRATFEIVFLSGWSPHESQQKPLAPGSAKVRLADALGTVERPAGDKAAFPAANPLSKKP
jgi:SAM-dependent methyltransferase